MVVNGRWLDHVRLLAKASIAAAFIGGTHGAGRL
jgi:hypothetical protein